MGLENKNFGELLVPISIIFINSVLSWNKSKVWYINQSLPFTRNTS